MIKERTLVEMKLYAKGNMRDFLFLITSSVLLAILFILLVLSMYVIYFQCFVPITHLVSRMKGNKLEANIYFAASPWCGDSRLFGPVVLGTNRCDESLPAILGEAECAWLKLRRWEDLLLHGVNDSPPKGAE